MQCTEYMANIQKYDKDDSYFFQNFIIHKNVGVTVLMTII